MTEPPQHPPTTKESDGAAVVTDAQQADRILEALSDSKCREILRATDGDALSAEELSECCDIALSTVYRKVEQLVDSGLLERRLRLSTHPQITREYRLAVTAVDVAIADESGVSLALSRRVDLASQSGSIDQSVTGD